MSNPQLPDDLKSAFQQFVKARSAPRPEARHVKLGEPDETERPFVTVVAPEVVNHFLEHYETFKPFGEALLDANVDKGFHFVPDWKDPKYWDAYDSVG